jgi:hypothetical protein
LPVNLGNKDQKKVTGYNEREMRAQQVRILGVYGFISNT